MRRMKARYEPLDTALREVKEKQLVALLEDRALRSLHYLDDYVLSGASARDLAVTTGVLIDKRQLLKGEPTAITRFQDIQKLDEAAKLLHAEMERRGMLVDVTPEKVEPDSQETATG